MAYIWALHYAHGGLHLCCAVKFPLLAEQSLICVHAGVVGILVRLLWPKMRRRSGRLGGKGAPGSARAAILNAFAALQPAELRPLLALFLAPIGVALRLASLRG